MLTKDKQIISLGGLMEHLSEEEPTDFYIALVGGARSSKSIQLVGDGRISILNEIDDTEDIVNSKSLFDTRTNNVGKAILAGNFYMYSPVTATDTQGFDMTYIKKEKYLKNGEWYYQIMIKGWFFWREYFGSSDQSKVDKKFNDMRWSPSVFVIH